MIKHGRVQSNGRAHIGVAMLLIRAHMTKWHITNYNEELYFI